MRVTLIAGSQQSEVALPAGVNVREGPLSAETVRKLAELLGVARANAGTETGNANGTDGKQAGGRGSMVCAQHLSGTGQTHAVGSGRISACHFSPSFCHFSHPFIFHHSVRSRSRW